MSILPEYKLYLSLHILIVYGLTTLVVYSSSCLKRFFIISSQPVLLEYAFLAKDSVYQPTGIIDIIVFNENCTSDKRRVSVRQ